MIVVPYSHDILVPIRDRAFSWDVSLENEELAHLTALVHEVPKFVSSIQTNTRKKPVASSSSSNAYDKKSSEHEVTNSTGNDEDEEDSVNFFDDTLIVVHEDEEDIHDLSIHLHRVANDNQRGRGRPGKANKKSTKKSTHAASMVVKPEDLMTPEQQKAANNPQSCKVEKVDTSSITMLGTGNKKLASKIALADNFVVPTVPSSKQLQSNITTADEAFIKHEKIEGNNQVLRGTGYGVNSMLSSAYLQQPVTPNDSGSNLLSSPDLHGRTLGSGINMSSLGNVTPMYSNTNHSSETGTPLSNNSIFGGGSHGITPIGSSYNIDSLTSERKVGIYTVEERKIKIEKFRERKRQRIWRKQIKYDCRKRLADTRPR